MDALTLSHVLMIVVFSLGYLAIATEHILKVNKTAIALLMSVLCWMCYFIGVGTTSEASTKELCHHLADTSQIVFFLLGAMALVELIDVHNGFHMISRYMKTHSKPKMLLLVTAIAFGLSAVIDNLTATIVMVSVIRKLVAGREDRLLLGSMVVIAANAGGAWTPIGDVTTTMLWIAGRLTTGPLMLKLILPSIACVLGSFFMLSRKMRGEFQGVEDTIKISSEPFGNIVLGLGLLCLMAVPILKAIIGLPPFMGMLIGLGVLWLFTDLAHTPHKERKHLMVPHVLSRIDTAGVLFFLGILLAVAALEASGILMAVAHWLDFSIGSPTGIATLIGLFSSVVDNVPLVAATIGMYGVKLHAANSHLWLMIALCAGTGGSILIIGSAAGIAFMGLEKVDFLWFLKRISLSALVGYGCGIAVFLLQSLL